MSPIRQRSEQTRILRSKLLRHMALSIAFWSLGFVLICAFLQVTIVPEIGNRIADLTSNWSYYDAQEVDSALKAGSTIDKDFQILQSDEGTYAVRDLSAYYAIRSLKPLIAIVIYAVGLVIIIVRTLNRSLSYIDDLTIAIADGRLLDGGKIELPGELSIASQQLQAFQKRIEEHEHSAILAEQRKNELVAYLAHDIRTPLTSVVGYLSLLAESPDLPIERRAKYAGIALEKALRLEALIEEFFEITRYNVSSIVLERENVDIGLFVQQVADEFGLAAEDRGVEVVIDAPSGQIAFIDPSKMARALGNVVKNAVAYSNPGTKVDLSAQAADEKLVFIVEDVGKEISKSHLERIFERFYREDGARGQEANAGLGLAIAREVVEAHGGTITAESEGGITTFRITIPMDSSR